jgi:CDP-4-dehydro-6-deoxyglucose reductase, E3
MKHGPQAAFLAVEAAFNRLLGERLNPFYYLGAIAYFQLWIVLVSGLYLYAFFETSVGGAYASVEALTHGQRWAGGLMRSLHRYASDGMVLAMLLHMARHATFGHHRGFRWFSWVSGVALLWGIYVSGINGYMLPWDELAQFVVISSAEWLDALPIFNGALARNFLHAASVNDRFFSLLSFLHIGLPLAALALLWVHTQRVPKAHTQPPAPIAAGVAAMLLVLSIAHPAVSHAPANLATVPAVLSLDWFYLPVLPLIYEWGIGQTWGLVAGATLALLALPARRSSRRGCAKACRCRSIAATAAAGSARATCSRARCGCARTRKALCPRPSGPRAGRCSAARSPSAMSRSPMSPIPTRGRSPCGSTARAWRAWYAWRRR